MIGNFRGKRLFGTRLFAGRLWGALPVEDVVDVAPPGGVGGDVSDADADERRIRRQNNMILALVACVTAGGLLE
jgi:hypothetical protein